VVWGVAAFAGLAWIARVTPAVRAAFRDPRTVAAMALSGALVMINWGAFVVAIQDDRLLDASLGYFINPLISVALGTLVLRERLRALQWCAIGFAVIGVSVLTWRIGRLPWISIVVATSFGAYGLVRKLAPFDSMRGLAIESGVMLPLALLYLLWCEHTGQGAFLHGHWRDDLLLVARVAPDEAVLVLEQTVQHGRVVGDVRGVLEIIRPLKNDEARVTQALQLTLLVSAIGSALLLLGSVLAVWARRRRIEGGDGRDL